MVGVEVGVGRDQCGQRPGGLREAPVERIAPKFSLHMCILSPPGGRDRAGRPLLLVSTPQGAWEAPWCTASEVTKLLSFLCTVPR